MAREVLQVAAPGLPVIVIVLPETVPALVKMVLSAAALRLLKAR